VDLRDKIDVRIKQNPLIHTTLIPTWFDEDDPPDNDEWLIIDEGCRMKLRLPGAE
jgi:hypothetical protein